ncbi:DnaB-like helicase C-terminal domain-containing protein [Streptomyces sp. NBC_00470]|uniref:DnaB-like helicase C-terminal domain-containing protein n=1 Tax=Streptomyces sp. NBC_00470 TaxID=2975753 RepID=UPI00324ACC55
MDFNFEQKLIARAVQEGELGAIQEAGITPQFFTGELSRQVFADLLAFDAEYGEPPTVDIVKADHPTFEMPDKADEPLEFLLHKLHGQRTHRVLANGVDSTLERLEAHDDAGAVQAVRRMLDLIDETDLTLDDTDWVSQAEPYLEDYKRRMEEGTGLKGLPTGFASLDAATGGMRPGQLISLIAPAKTGKTMLTLGVALSLLAEGYSVLFFTYEMTARDISERMYAYHSGVSSKGLRMTTLSEHEFRKLGRSLKALKHQEGSPSLVVVEDRGSSSTVSQIRGKVSRYRPDVVIIDGLYFLTDEKTGQRMEWVPMTNIVQDTKRMALRCDLPVFATSQAKRQAVGGLSLTSAGYTAAFEHYSDVLFGLEKTKVPDLLLLSILASRVCATEEFHLTVDYDKGIVLERPAEDAYGPRDNFYESLGV